MAAITRAQFVQKVKTSPGSSMQEQGAFYSDHVLLFLYTLAGSWVEADSGDMNWYSCEDGGRTGSALTHCAATLASIISEVESFSH